MDTIESATSVTDTIHISRALQIAQHPVCIAFRDTRGLRELPHAQVRVLSNGEQDLGVIRDEGPAPGQRGLHQARLTRLRHRSTPRLLSCNQAVQTASPCPAARTQKRAT